MVTWGIGGLMRTLIATAALAIAACTGTASLAIDDYEDAARDAVCRNLAKCGDVESREVCRTVNLGVVVHLQPGEQRAIEMGKVEFHGDQANACLDALADRSCDVTSRSGRVTPPECQFVTGTQPAGRACALDDECTSLRCGVPSCGDACCQGTCVGDTPATPGHVGDSCETAACDDDSFCDLDTALCVARAPAHATCFAPDECDFGLDCLPDGTCGPLPGPGEPCDGACRDRGTTCSQTTGVCVKVALAGEACATSADCSVLYACDATKHCSRGLALGAACTAGQFCADARAFCDPTTTPSTCALPKPDGEACTRSLQCQTVYCDPASLTCAEEPVCF